MYFLASSPSRTATVSFILNFVSVLRGLPHPVHSLSRPLFFLPQYGQSQVCSLTRPVGLTFSIFQFPPYVKTAGHDTRQFPVIHSSFFSSSSMPSTRRMRWPCTDKNTRRSSGVRIWYLFSTSRVVIHRQRTDMHMSEWAAIKFISLFSALLFIFLRIRLFILPYLSLPV